MIPEQDIFIRLDRFMKALIAGTLFDDPRTAEWMRSDWKTFPFTLNPMRMGWPIEYGLGMMRFRMPRLFSSQRTKTGLVEEALRTFITVKDAERRRATYHQRVSDLDRKLSGLVLRERPESVLRGDRER